MGTANVKRWDERIARAGRLAAEYPAAADLLSFYGSLAEYQKSLIQNLVVAGPHPRDLYLAPLALGDAFGSNLLSEATPSPGPHRRPVPLRGAPAKMGTVPFFDAVDFEPVLAAIPDFLSWLQCVAPAPLKKAAGEMRGLERSAWRHLIDLYLTDDGQEFDAARAPSPQPSPPPGEREPEGRVRGSTVSSSSAAPGFESSLKFGFSRPFEDLKPVTAFVVEAVLQPFAENVARAQTGDGGAGPYSEARGPTHATERSLTFHAPSSMARAALLGGPATERVPTLGAPLINGAGPHPRDGAARENCAAPYSSEGSRCTVCGGRAVVGVLREEGQGARRTLVCGLCLTERDYLRVVCPACGEQRFDALPVYTADQFEHVRIEACDSCRTYLKTIDLTKNGLAVPLVDDIASVTMDLWARDGGYARLRPNLLRM